MSIAEFSITHFKNPMNRNQAWSPRPAQLDLYDVLEFGYPVGKRFIEPPNPIEVVVITTPRQVGKTEGIASASAAEMLLKPDMWIGIMSNKQSNARKLTRRIKRFICDAGCKSDIIEDNSEHLELKNGSSVDSFGMTQKIRGNSYKRLIIDEAAYFKEELLEGDAIPTTRTAGMFNVDGTPSVILLSTPRGYGNRFAKYFSDGVQSRFIGCRKCKKLHPLSEYEQIGVKWFIFDNLVNVPKNLPPCSCGSSDFEYVDNIYSIITIDPYTVRPKHVVEAELMRRGNTPLARQEILGEFIGGGQTVFREEWLQNCIDKGITNGYLHVAKRRYIMGLDFGKSNDYTVYTVVHNNEEGNLVVDWLDIILGTHEYIDIRQKTIDYLIFWNPAIIVADATGIGSPIGEEIERDIKLLKREGVTIQGVGEYTREYPRISNLVTRVYSNKQNHVGFLSDIKSKRELIEYLQVLFMETRIRIADRNIYKIEELWNELLNFSFEISPSGNIKYGVQTYHDDCVISLALAAWGARTKEFIFKGGTIDSVAKDIRREESNSENERDGLHEGSDRLRSYRSRLKAIAEKFG